MIMYSGSFLSISLLCCSMHTSLGIEIGISKTIYALLNDFNSPLKLTLMSCWTADTTIQFVRSVTNDRPFFRIKIVNGNETTPNIFDQHQEAIIADINCDNVSTFFAKVSRHMFNLYKIIVFDSAVYNIDAKIEQLFVDSPIFLMSQIYYITKDFAQDKFAVKQVYRIGFNEPFTVETFAYYDGKQYVRKTDITSVLRRRNLNGSTLKASMVILNNDSLSHLDDYRDIHVDTLSKLGYQLTNHLMQFVNATVKYFIVPTWGYKNQTTGKWNGMLGEILSNEADIGTTALFFTPERVSMLEYISRPSTANLGFLFRSPRLSYTNNIYLLPFDRLLWMCLFLLVFVLAMCLGGTVLFELKVLSNVKDNCQLGDVSMIIFGAVCQQGTAVTPNSVTGRIIMAIAFTILMFLYVSYSANIVALLQSPSNQIKTLQDLYESKLGVSVEDTVYNRHYFPRETETLRKKFFEEKLVNKDGKPKFIALEDGMKRVREGQFAFYTEYPSAYKIIGETFLDIEKCGLKEISFFQMKLNPWYAIQKNSSYKEIFKVGMMRINEHGLQHRENLKLFMTKPKCLGSGGNFESANLLDTGPAMLILLWGMVITMMVFICELFLAHSKFIKNKITILLNKIVNKGSSK